MKRKADVFVPKKSLGISRADMPQIKSNLVPEFIKWLQDSGVRVSKKTVRAADLKPTQREVNMGKVQKLAHPKNMAHLRKPVIVSKDGYLLDGHHRWRALVMMDSESTIPAVLVGLKIRDLLDWAHNFEGVNYKDLEAARKGNIMDSEGVARELVAVAKLLTAAPSMYKQQQAISNGLAEAANVLQKAGHPSRDIRYLKSLQKQAEGIGAFLQDLERRGPDDIMALF